MFQNVPIHRIFFGVFSDEEILNRLSGIIRNPDFDAFELERHINKADKLNYACLANKRLHLVRDKDYLTISLLEKTALLSEKTQALNTNITIYYSRNVPELGIYIILDESNFLENYIERRNWKNAFTLTFSDFRIPYNEKDIIYNESLPTSFCK